MDNFKKKLSEMSLEELWKLFPIFLTDYKECWEEWYDAEVSYLKSLLVYDIDYYHIGSTAIKGIMAKPIIDIIVAVNNLIEMKEVKSIMQKHGYTVMSHSDNRVSLNKGYTENGYAERVFHFHIRLKDDIDEIYFRDYLNSHSDVAKEYEKLKLNLWKKFEYNRDGYTEAKKEFVCKYTDMAKKYINSGAVKVVAALIRDGNKFLICQRPKNKSRPLLWEFAGGKVEKGETKEQALIRECNEELNIIIKAENIFMEVTHNYPDIVIHLTLYNAIIQEGIPAKKEHNDIKWITKEEIDNYEFCPADKEILKRLKSQ